MKNYKQCQFNISSEELDRLNEICTKFNLKQAQAIEKCVKSYLNGELEEKLYSEVNVEGWSKKIINIEEETYNLFMQEADFRCRTLVSLIRFSINAFYEHELML